MHWPLSTPQKHYFSASDAQRLVRLEGLGKLKKTHSTSSGLNPVTFQLVA
jgi:hypothetical protein